MPDRSLIRLGLISFGIALLLAGLFFDGGLASFDLQTTPTPDRLAEPTLPASPSQADEGAQVYWLSCLPCHGDAGQGLTDEFRAVYPPEEQNCWVSGCHGAKPYESGFTIPKFIPAVIGKGSLYKFTDALQLNIYIHAAMPFWKPGSLTDEEAWQVTAFLLRENGIRYDAIELNETNASGVRFMRQPLTPLPTVQQAEGEERGAAGGWVVLSGMVISFAVLFFILQRLKED